MSRTDNTMTNKTMCSVGHFIVCSSHYSVLLVIVLSVLLITLFCWSLYYLFFSLHCSVGHCIVCSSHYIVLLVIVLSVLLITLFCSSLYCLFFWLHCSAGHCIVCSHYKWPTEQCNEKNRQYNDQHNNVMRRTDNTMTNRTM
jgi:magnesium-transporting ATPase (P-type)